MLAGQLFSEGTARWTRETGRGLALAHLAQVAGGSLGQPLFGPKNNDRGAAGEDFHWRDFVAAATPRRLCPSEPVEVALAELDRAERSYAGAPDLDLEGRGTATLGRRRGAVAVDEGPVDRSSALSACMPVGRPALSYGFEREAGNFRTRVVEAVGIERLCVCQGQVVVCGTACGQGGEKGQAEEDGAGAELSWSNNAPSV